MRKEFNDISGGIVKDILPTDLPDNMWSDGQNVRFIAQGLERINGDTTALLTSPPIVPYYAQNFRVDSSNIWAWFGESSIYAATGSIQADVSRTGGYSTVVGDGWTGGVLKGVSIVTNGSDAPQSWIPTTALDTKYGDLLYDYSSSTSWADAEVRAQVIRVHGDYAIALDTTEAGIRNYRRVWWSHPSGPLEEPKTWDYSKPAFDAGFTDLDETDARILDGAHLRDSFIIYKEDSVYSMTFVPDNRIFVFKRLFSSFGAIARHCIVPFYNQHIVLTHEDLLLHDGVQVKSVLNNRYVRWLAANLDPDYASRSFLARNLAKKEIWAFIPSAGKTWPDFALLWSWENNSISIRETGECAFAVAGSIDPSLTAIESYDTQTGTFDTDTGPYDVQAARQYKNRLCLFTLDNNMLVTDYGSTFYETGGMVAFVERSGLSLGDKGQNKFISAIYPRVDGAVGRTLTVKVGSQSSVGAPIKYTDYSYTIGDDKVDCRVTGRFITIRFESVDVSYPWRLQGYDIEYNYRGTR